VSKWSALPALLSFLLWGFQYSTGGLLGLLGLGFVATNSGIWSVDIASEMSELTRAQILKQMAAALLVLASRAPSLALQLPGIWSRPNLLIKQALIPGAQGLEFFSNLPGGGCDGDFENI